MPTSIAQQPWRSTRLERIGGRLTGGVVRQAMPAHTVGNTIFLTPAAGHASITEGAGGPVVWETTFVPAGTVTNKIRTWIGLLAHELTHAAGLANRDEELLPNQVGVFFESLHDAKVLPLLPVPYNAGPRPSP